MPSFKFIFSVFLFPPLIFHLEQPHYKKMDHMYPVYSVSPASFYVKPTLCEQLALCALALSSRSGSPAGLAQGTECAGSCLGRDWLSVKKATDTD